MRRLLLGVAVLALAAGVMWFVRSRNPDRATWRTRELATWGLARAVAAQYPGKPVLIVSNPFTRRPGATPEVRAQEEAGLRAVNRLLQDFLTDLKFAGLFLRLRILANVAGFGVVNLSAALGTLADDVLAREINFGRRLFRAFRAGLLLPGRKFKSGAAILGDQKRLERTIVLLRNEFRQKVGFALGQQFFDLFGRDLLLQNNLPGLKGA